MLTLPYAVVSSALSFSTLSSKTASLKPNDLDIRVRLSSSIPTISLIDLQDSSLDFTPKSFGRSNNPGFLFPLLSVATMMLRTSVLFMLNTFLFTSHTGNACPTPDKIEPWPTAVR